MLKSFGTENFTQPQPQPQALKTTTPVFGTNSGNLGSVLSGGGTTQDSSTTNQLSPVQRVSGWLVGQLPSTSDGNTSSTNNLAPNTNTGNEVVGVGDLSKRASIESSRL